MLRLSLFALENDDTDSRVSGMRIGDIGGSLRTSNRAFFSNRAPSARKTTRNRKVRGQVYARRHHTLERREAPSLAANR